jgi:hypothetical protein
LAIAVRAHVDVIHAQDGFAQPRSTPRHSSTVASRSVRRLRARGDQVAGPGRRPVGVHHDDGPVPGGDIPLQRRQPGLYEQDLLGKLRIRGESTNANEALFIGIGAADDVAAYLDGVKYGDDEHRPLG